MKATFSILIFTTLSVLAADQILPGTKPLTVEGDLSAQMVAGISRFLDQQLASSIESRQQYWNRDFSSAAAFAKSIEANRQRFRKIIGVVDERPPVKALEYVATTSSAGVVADTAAFTVLAVRWQSLPGVYAEGLLVVPKAPVRAYVVAIPDADQTPEQILGLAPGVEVENQFARWLALAGCQVVIPTMLDRGDELSGSKKLGIFINQPHREWIYRQAFEMGRHVIGYEVQKVLAAVDWFKSELARSPNVDIPIGVAGYAEGGLVALYAAASDPRIDSALVSGYYQSRQNVWQEPIYRNVIGLLREFGDAEIATLIAPKQLVIEYSPVPEITGPPQPGKGRRSGAAPGSWKTPDYSLVRDEWLRAIQLMAGAPNQFAKPVLVSQQGGEPTGPGSSAAILAFLGSMNINDNPFSIETEEMKDARIGFDSSERRRTQFQQMEDFTQTLLRHASSEREKTFWSKYPTTTPDQWLKDTQPAFESFRDEVIGWFNDERLPLNPRARLLKETDKWVAYEVVLDVWTDVYAWGYLLVPKGIKPGEKRPVVVCQHGLEGVPADVIDEDEKSRSWGPYKAFAAKLAERGFITFAPHNPYRGKDAFRVLQRKLNPLGRSLFSVIIRQHEAIMDWLQSLPNVDPERIGFYGLSYGGKSAMRIPALERRYALSICSADFNEWVWKNASVDWRSTYMFTGEYEIYEWDLGHTFNYAEMAGLICPRPFMVERGHKDGVGVDEWVAFEYAKIRRLYDYLDIGNRTEIEWFNGPHTINGQGTYRFLHKHLNWPEPK